MDSCEDLERDCSGLVRECGACIKSLMREGS